MRSGRSPPIGVPRSLTDCGSHGTRPVIALSSVDLPAPLAPMSASTSPSSRSKSTPNNAWKSPYPALRPRAASRGSAMGEFPFEAHVDLGDLRARHHRARIALGDLPAEV